MDGKGGPPETGGGAGEAGEAAAAPWGARAALRDRATWLVLAVALALRLALFLVAAPEPERRVKPDSRDYLALAESLASRGEFARAPGAEPETFRAPGYPVFLVPFAAAFEKPANAVALLQVLLDCGTAMLVVLFCAARLGRAPALVAGGLYAAALSPLCAANLVLSETLFTLLLTGALLLAGTIGLMGPIGPMGSPPAAYRLPPTVLAALAGLALGLATLVRTVAAPLAALLAIFMVMRGTRGRRAIPTALLLAAFAIPTGAWAARNAAAGAGCRLSTVGTEKLLYYDAAGFQARAEGRPAAEVRGELLAEAERRAEKSGDRSIAAKERVERGLALEILGAHPVRAALYWLRCDAAGLLPDASDLLELAGQARGERGTLEVLQKRGVFAAARHYLGAQEGDAGARVLWLVIAGIFGLVLAATYVLAAVGAARLVRQREFALAALLVVPVAWLLLVPGAASHPRFAVPAMPLLCALAAFGWPRKKPQRLTTADAENHNGPD